MAPRMVPRIAEGQPLNAGKITEFGGLDRKDVDKAMTKLKKEV